jgi:phosphoribosyl 1,2-cyclic phosphodiesterase
VATIEVQFWGTRGSIATPGPATAKYGGNTSCVEIRVADQLLICDAGTGARALGVELSERMEGRPINAHLLISHTHWDHIQGIPFFMPAYEKGNKITIVGPSGIDRTLERVIRGQMDPHYFPVEMDNMAAELKFREAVERSFSVGDVVVKRHYLHHPAPSVAYRIEYGGHSVVYATDHEFYRRMYEARGDSAEMLAEADRHDAEFEKFIEGTDLYIADAQYTLDEYGSKIGWGHSTVEDVATVAARSGVARLVLYHHDPMRSDPEVEWVAEMARTVIGKPIPVTAAREGATLSV